MRNINERESNGKGTWIAELIRLEILSKTSTNIAGTFKI